VTSDVTTKLNTKDQNAQDREGNQGPGTTYNESKYLGIITAVTVTVTVTKQTKPQVKTKQNKTKQKQNKKDVCTQVSHRQCHVEAKKQAKRNVRRRTDLISNPYLSQPKGQNTRSRSGTGLAVSRPWR
jgi:hypothetical protein